MATYTAVILLCSLLSAVTLLPTTPEKVTCVTGNGDTYRGTIAVTESGKTCQMWNSQTPHKHYRNPEKYSFMDLTKNFCRNPNNSMKPWCYTTDPKSRWEFCKIHRCAEKPSSEECMHCSGEDYRGKVSTTELGFTCQRWDSQKPHSHKYLPENFPDKFLEENYCRNPDGEPRPWCYTTNSSKRWDYCSIHRCASPLPTVTEELTCATGEGKAYRGNISVTESGKTCQMWNSQSPHEHSNTPETFPCKGLTLNYCRNPNNAEMPWCYTTDVKTRWEYCKVPRCGEEHSQEECMHCSGEEYRGKVSTTELGFTCQRWDSQQPHYHKYYPEDYPDKFLEENYCRNIGGQPRPWCHTTDPSKRWDYCSIPRCASPPPIVREELICMTGIGKAYRGNISVTESGKTCQMWNSQLPHRHEKTPEDFPCSGLTQNYCRNPGNEKMPWCYTTNPETRWEFCKIPMCGAESSPEECMHCSGEDYRGKVSTTELGFTCQRWDSLFPHYHKFLPKVFPDKFLEENYCRNPNGEPRPWCYTTDRSYRWDFCSIPRCASPPPAVIEDLCITGNGSDYRGTIAVTKSGKTCQMWSSQKPHGHFISPENYPCKDLTLNYCRNPNNKKMPWCYTTDPRTRWEYCNVLRCGEQPESALVPTSEEDY